MRNVISAYVAGLLFGVGLILSGMSDPANVLGFFDVLGTWNPTLAFVMAGGLGVTFVGYAFCMKRTGPLCAAAYQIPSRSDIDRRLIGGAAVFGLGWGLVGYCPGPALVAAGAGSSEGAAFAGAMALGMLAWRAVEQGVGRRTLQRA